MQTVKQIRRKVLSSFLGSFDWSWNYKRLPITKEDEKHPTRPFDSPVRFYLLISRFVSATFQVMAGGYFAISTKWFWELGGYDEGLGMYDDIKARRTASI